MQRLTILAVLALGLMGLASRSVATAGAVPWTGTVVSARDVGSSWPLQAPSAQIACSGEGAVGGPSHNAVSVVVSHRRYALDKQAGWLGAHPVAPILRAGASTTSVGVIALRLLAHRLCTRQAYNLACDVITSPPTPCDPLAAYPQSQTALCHATCPFLADFPGDHLVPAPTNLVLRVTVDPPDVAVRGIVYGCTDDVGLVPFVARSGDTIPIASAGENDCFVTATALWTEPYSARARHVVTLAIVPA